MCANFSVRVNIPNVIAYKLVYKTVYTCTRYQAIYQTDYVYEKAKRYSAQSSLHGFHAYKSLDDARCKAIRSPRSIIVKVLLEEIYEEGLDGSSLFWTKSYDESKNEPPIYVARYQTILEEV